MPHKDPEKAREYQRRYREKNHEKLKAYHAEYFQEHKEQIAESQKENQRAWYLENKDKVAAKSSERSKSPERKLYDKSYYEEHREEILEKQKSRYHDDPNVRQKQRETLRRAREERKLWLLGYKEDKSCKYCNEQESCCLDFHHRDPESKEDLISNMVNQVASMERILAEVEKCDIVCANCHRKIHAGILLECEE